MILVDPRIGSEDLVPLLQQKNMKTCLQTLPSGDFAFEGHLQVGSGLIGIERKKIKDLCASVRGGRLTEQINNMNGMYDFVWVLVEGMYRPAKDGILEHFAWKDGRTQWMPLELGTQRFMYREVDKYLMTATMMHPKLRVIRSSTDHESAEIIANMWRWYNEKEWGEHRSHLALHQASEFVSIIKPSLVRRIANELPDVGHQRSIPISKHFLSTIDMVNAPIEEWMKIKGAEIGRKRAERIHDALWGLID
jgi:ERCC4-type nuclease